MDDVDEANLKPIDAFWNSRRVAAFLLVNFVILWLWREWLPNESDFGFRQFISNPLVGNFFYLSLLCTWFGYFRALRTSFCDAYGFCEWRWRWVLLCIGVTLMLWPFHTMLQIVSMFGLPATPLHSLPRVVSLRNPEWGLEETASAVILIVWHPIFEEILFRWVAFSGLMRYSKTLAVVLTALAFGLLHDNDAARFSTFIFGAWFAFIRLKSGSIVPTLLAHVVLNAMAPTAAWLAGLYLQWLYGL